MSRIAWYVILLNIKKIFIGIMKNWKVVKSNELVGKTARKLDRHQLLQIGIRWNVKTGCEDFCKLSCIMKYTYSCSLKLKLRLQVLGESIGGIFICLSSFTYISRRVRKYCNFFVRLTSHMHIEEFIPFFNVLIGILIIRLTMH